MDISVGDRATRSLTLTGRSRVLHVRGAPVSPRTCRIRASFRARVGLAISLAVLGGLFAPLPSHAQSARDIIDQVDRLMRGESSIARMTMDIKTENWDRSLTMRTWSLGTDHSLIRVESPQREAGTATLMANREVWNYLPRVDRTIKVPSSMMAGSWMGSHFSNDDLVKESRLVDDYEIELDFEGERDGVEVWEFVLTPLPEAPVVWGKIRWAVRKQYLG